MDRRGITGGNIARTTRHKFIRYSTATGLLEGLNCLQYAITLAGSQVDSETAGLRKQPAQGRDMTACQVHDVDVIAYPGAIGSRIVIAEYRKPGAAPDGDLGDERHQVVRNAARIFADQAAG